MSPNAVYKLSADLSQAGRWEKGLLSPSPHCPTSPRSYWRPLLFAHIYTEQSWGAGLWPDFARLFQHLRVLAADQPWVFLNPGLGQPLCHILVGAWTECVPQLGELRVWDSFDNKHITKFQDLCAYCVPGPVAGMEAPGGLTHRACPRGGLSLAGTL